MESPQSLSKLKVTLFYWPNANMGLGHVACVVQEVPKQSIAGVMRNLIGNTPEPKATYVTPRFSAQFDDASGEEKYLPEEYLNAELATYESPSVIKIELPSVALGSSWSEFQAKLVALDKKEYNFLTNNCAHLATKVLTMVYGKDMNLEAAIQKPMLLPSKIARAACSYLDKHSSEKNNTERLQTLAKLGPTAEVQFTTGTVSRISKFEFAKRVIPIKLYEIGAIKDQLIDKLGIRDKSIKPSLLKAFQELNTAATDFGDLLGQKNPSDSDLTKSFTELKTKMDSLENQLGKFKDELAIFNRLKFWLYKFLGIALQDPKLESLRRFSEVARKIKLSYVDLGISTEPRVTAKLPGKV